MTEPVRYQSTRGTAPELDFGDVLLAGLATDGGLYVPTHWPTLATDVDPDASYIDTANEVIAPFVGDTFTADELAEMIAAAYGSFHHDEVVPLVDLGDGRIVLELFWGPTLAFKDVALQLVGHMFEKLLTARQQRLTIVGATSGDTGSAAIEACRDREALDIFVLFPKGRVSEVQRRQMTTVASPNVHAVEIEGTFDDCQDLVKAMFGHPEFRDDVNLGAVNSINWARVMAQVVYYVYAARKVGKGAPVSFSVPTGNFGNVFAAETARRMGTPIDQLIVGSNRNDILTQFFSTGSMAIGSVEPSHSPSMDIQVSSNLERLLFELYGRDGASLTEAMLRFRGEGVLGLGVDQMADLSETWSGTSVSDDETLDAIGRYQEQMDLLVDPHTAVGLVAAERLRRNPETPIVSLATAHPAKFPDAVQRATGVVPALPDHLADLHSRVENYQTLPNDLAVVEAFVQEHRSK